MMYFTKDQIESAAKHVGRYVELTVIHNPDNILVIADNSQAINEFEAQLAASTLVWDEEDTNGRILLDNLVNVQGVRTEFRQRAISDEWQARYEITTR